MKNNGNVRMIERCFFTGLPGPKIMKKAKFGHKWFQKRSSHKNERRPNVLMKICLNNWNNF